LSVPGCINNEPVPPEVKLAEAQEFNLWRAGTHLYLPEQYTRYKSHFSKAKDDLIKVNSHFKWFRDYKSVHTKFAQLLKQGDELLKRLEVEKHMRALSVLEQINTLRERIHTLDKLTLMMNEGTVSRSSLTKAEVILNEVRSLYKQNQYIASEEKLKNVEVYLIDAEKVIAPILNRYQDINQITKWRKWAKGTVEESREKGIYSILVIKAERKLILYKNGEPLKTYRVGLGRNGWSDKWHARDDATPEGKYRIIRKNPMSKYFKALLINYPNEEDKKEFHIAKRKGLLPRTANIGGSIEIHGGGNEGMTYGCISLDNRQIKELYDIVEVGTPVTIVGMVNDRNSISSALTLIQSTYGQKKAP
jgi:murein L,D-transpeptidase YafK